MSRLYRIIVGFPKQQDAVNIRNALARYSFQVTEPCTLGAHVIAQANDLDAGIVVCGHRFSDMHYSELHQYLPKGFEMLLIASPEKLEYSRDNDIVCLPMPIKTQDLISTLNMMTYQYQRRKKKEREKPKVRSEEEIATIDKAKKLIMERNNMTEDEAHRYLQKTSMDSGVNFVEMAEMVLKLF